jgi:hypothetical protein
MIKFVCVNVLVVEAGIEPECTCILAECAGLKFVDQQYNAVKEGA